MQKEFREKKEEKEYKQDINNKFFKERKVIFKGQKKEAQVVENIDVFFLPKDITKDDLDKIRTHLRSQDREKNLEQLGDIKVFKHLQKHNIIVTSGRSVLTRLLAGDTTYTGEITRGALGDGVADVVNGRTTLVNEVYRKVTASQTFDSNVAYVDFFYEATDVDGTFTEFGNFIDGTDTPDDGVLWSYIDTGGWVKPNTQSLFVACRYTIV